MKTVTAETYSERMLGVLVHIQSRLDEELPLGELARLSHFSPFHFHRIFRGMTGETVKGHIRRLRLERAAVHLKSTRRPVTRLAFEAGYGTHESFTRAFHEMFGCSPSAYRRTHRPVSFSRAPSGVHFRPGRRVIFQPLQGGREMKVEVKRLEPMHAAFVRHVGPYEQCGQAWDKVMAWMGAHGLLTPEARFFGISHDDPEVTPAEKIRYDACITVDGSFHPQGGIGVLDLPGGLYAMATHHGPYNNLGQTYAALCGQWAPGSGYELRSAPCLEFYLNCPDSTDPEDLLTDVYVPLEDFS